MLINSTRVEDILIPDDPRTAEADYALRINGDSMEPKYLPRFHRPLRAYG